MNIRQIAALILWVAVIAASNTIAIIPNAGASPTPAQSNISFTTQQQGMIKQLQAAKIIYLGETHDRQSDHQQQLAIIQTLFKHKPQISICMEMFQSQMQPLLDRYLAGKMTATELRQQSEFDKRWGYPWEYYAPILEFAKANRLPVIALNTPGEIARKAARKGLESLSTIELQSIPPVAEIDRSNAKYQQMILGSYQQHAGIVSIASKNFDRFYTAQLLWDETMAANTANFVKQNPNYQTIVLAGSSHIIYGYGIPDRVLRRLKQPKSIQKTVLLNLDADLQQPEIADFIWSKNEKTK
jgi:uncharacterized iron-regulated protein